ncbi:MAG TPA: rhomboid family intramembrane serine protease [Pyrinomonadaceae bacterium]|nr:rhomboid family intramembrane serine protease [Pyrinomonadaceae bacterium]
MCRSCGAIVGAGETQCGVCGAPTAPQHTTQAGPRPPDKETIRFARTVLSRPYKFTIIFLILNLFVFLLMWESSGVAFRVLQRGFPDLVLITFGAKLNYLINPPNNQWWRFITPVFVHIDVLHLVMNMFALLILGPFVEKLYGSAKFVVFWVVTGIAGVVGSYLSLRPSLAHGILGNFIFRDADVPSAGASGALFGLIGILFVFGIKYRRELPEGFKRVFGTGMLPIIFINLFIGFVGSNFIGNAAHLGGLFTGAALALFVDYRRPGARAGITTAWRALQIACLLVIAVGAYKVARNFGRPIPAPPRVASNANANTLIFLNYVNAMNQVQEKVSAVIHNNDLSNLELVTEKAMQAPVPDARAAELRLRLLSILSRLASAAAEASPPPENKPGRPPVVDQKLVDEYTNWRKEYDEWLKGAAKTRGAP